MKNRHQKPTTDRGRRSFLKGVTLGSGALVLQPVLQSLAAQAAGAEGPRRVVFVIEGNGLFPQHIQPRGLERFRSGADKLIDVSLTDYELPEPIAALTPFKDRMMILQGLSGQVARAFHSTCYGTLGCYNGEQGGTGRPLDQTIDSALSDSLPGIFPLLALGVASDPGTAIAHNFSATAPNKPVPIQCHPQRAFQLLFGSLAGGDAAKLVTIRESFLDHMAADVRRVRASLAGPEREKLGSYLEAYEAMRKRQMQIAEIEDRLRANMPHPDKFVSPVESDRFQAQFDLAASAILSGLTNVVTISSGVGGQDYITWHGLGVPIDGHRIGHGTGHDGKSAEELRVIIRQFHARQIARLAAKLAAVREGDGTVLDRTLIVYLSDAADSHHTYDCTQWPVVLLGNLGGRLKTNGRFLEYPGYGRPGHRTMANLYLSLLHAVGDRRETFGLPDVKLRDIDQSGPLAELLA